MLKLPRGSLLFLSNDHATRTLRGKQCLQEYMRLTSIEDGNVARLDQVA